MIRRIVTVNFMKMPQSQSKKRYAEFGNRRTIGSASGTSGMQSNDKENEAPQIIDCRPSRNSSHSLVDICTRFLKEYPLRELKQGEYMIVDVTAMTNKLNTERRRLYDILNIFESLGLTSKDGKSRYLWMGLTELKPQLSRLKKLAMQLKLNPKTGNYERTAEQNMYWKHNNLGMLCQKFIMLFLNTDYPHKVNYEIIVKFLADLSDEAKPHRRVYDICNVLTVLKLIKKVPGDRKVYEYLGPVVEAAPERQDINGRRMRQSLLSPCGSSTNLKIGASNITSPGSSCSTPNLLTSVGLTSPTSPFAKLGLNSPISPMASLPLNSPTSQFAKLGLNSPISPMASLPRNSPTSSFGRLALTSPTSPLASFSFNSPGGFKFPPPKSRVPCSSSTNVISPTTDIGAVSRKRTSSGERYVTPGFLALAELATQEMEKYDIKDRNRKPKSSSLKQKYQSNPEACQALNLRNVNDSTPLPFLRKDNHVWPLLTEPSSPHSSPARKYRRVDQPAVNMGSSTRSIESSPSGSGSHFSKYTMTSGYPRTNSPSDQPLDLSLNKGPTTTQSNQTITCTVKKVNSAETKTFNLKLIKAPLKDINSNGRYPRDS